ncbi:hypothetical protein [Lactococcus allomyrinae]|uniref:Uncharacterized protein n=1 Tax=Lactococcus allomyrinae TaxID=2419773 RepID=A0A387BFM6_9LACT|nr:hypothetical protein [Lactococcus allomyrinae]AYF99776.1 hypothetical protein D7I46_00945 [Lactococcus allomyrinae]
MSRIDRTTADYIFSELSAKHKISIENVKQRFVTGEGFEPIQGLWRRDMSMGYQDKRGRLHVRPVTLKEWQEDWKCMKEQE